MKKHYNISLLEVNNPTVIDTKDNEEESLDKELRFMITRMIEEIKED
jgi:hypothetical protein